MTASYLKKKQQQPAQPTAAQYVFIGRASTKEQGASVQLQLERCAEWAEQKGVELVCPLTQDEMLFSGGKKWDDRPDLKFALEEIAAGRARGIVATKLDRICRSIQTFAQLLEQMEKIGGELIILDLGIDTTNINSKLMLHIMSAMAQWERETIVTRVKEGIAASQEKGKKWTRQAPFGYEWYEGYIRPSIEEQKFIDWVKMRYEPGSSKQSGRMSLHKLEEIARVKGFRNRHGNYYAYAEVKRALHWRPNPDWEIGVQVQEEEAVS